MDAVTIEIPNAQHQKILTLMVPTWTPPPPPPALHAMYWALNTYSDRISTHQLAEGHHQTSPYTARARHLVHTAARGQGAPERVVQRIQNLTAPKNRVSQPQEVGVGWNRG